MKLKDILTLSLIGLLTFSTLIFTGFVLWNNVLYPNEMPVPATKTCHISNWGRYRFHGAHVGTSTAPVQIVEFFDYQCPYCKQMQSAIKFIRSKYPKVVNIIYENFPLPTHNRAYQAAIAAECVRKQGLEPFMDYRDSLFVHQLQLDTISFLKLVKKMGITDTTI